MVVAVTAIGCGETSHGPAATSSVALERSTFLPELVKVFCQALRPCCSAVGLPHDQAACAVDATVALGWKFLAINSAYATFDATAADACLKGYATYVGRCAGPSYWDLTWNEDLDPVLRSCGDVLTGTKALGDACAHSQECRVSTSGPVDCDGHCSLRAAVIPPTPAYVHVGEACHSEANLEICIDPCEPGTFCDDGTCAARHASGSCMDVCNLACADESYCKEHVCMPRPHLPVGAVCTTGVECEGANADCIRSMVCGPELLYGCTKPM